MKSNPFLWTLVGLVVAAALACSAEKQPWNGTWKLNEAKSNIPGPSFSLTLLPTGEYHSDNGTYSFNFRCDGKDYPTRGTRTISCAKTGESVMDATTKENGKNVGTAHWKLSVDESTLTINGTSVESDGSVKTHEKVYRRTFGSNGFTGGWNDTERLKSHPPMVLALSERTLHIAFSGSGEYMDPPLDGTDAPCHGPGVPEGLTVSIRPNGTREFLTLRRLHGQVLNQGSLRLSTDGRTLVEEYWKPEKPDQKATLVYDKQ